MKHFLLVISFLISSVPYLKAKTLYSALKEGSLDNPLKYPPPELNGEEYSRLFDGIISKLGETKGQIIDVVPAGLVYDFKLFLPFFPPNDKIKKNGDEKQLEGGKGEEDVEPQQVTEGKGEEVTEENKERTSALTENGTTAGN